MHGGERAFMVIAAVWLVMFALVVIDAFIDAVRFFL